jgi:hypothetical protein
MSKITPALSKISFWIEHSESAHAQFIKNGTLDRFYPQPGLEKEIIELYVQEMNFKMPEEVYDLYQWHDGEFEVGDYANPVVFQSFDQAFSDFKSYRDIYGFKNGISFFPIFHGDGCVYGIDEATDNLVSSPIRFYEGLGSSEAFPGFYAPSLTSLILAIAEYAERYDGISSYWMKTDPNHKIKNDAAALSPIYQQYGIVGTTCGLWR